MLIDHPLDQPTRLRREALLAAIPRVGAEAAQSYMLVRGADQVVRFHGIRGSSAVRPAVDRWRTAEGLAFLLTDIGPDHVAPLDELGFAPEGVYGSALWRFGFAEFGYQRLLYMNVTTRSEMRGHVSFLSQSGLPWDVSPATRAAVAAEVGAAFRAAWDAEVRLAPPDGATATLLPDGSVVADDATEAWIAAHDATEWLRERAEQAHRMPRTLIGRSDRHWAPGAFLTCRPIPGGGTLLTFERIRPMRLPPVLAKLTSVQRRIASLAASGATAGEIAEGLGRSPETVREHITRIYERLGVGSRAELASVCRRIFV